MYPNQSLAKRAVQVHIEDASMITTRAAFISGAIFSAAFITSIVRRKQYSSFRQWWDSEGIAIWILAALFGGGLLISN
jgi:hypothetical protein